MISIHKPKEYFATLEFKCSKISSASQAAEEIIDDTLAHKVIAVNGVLSVQLSRLWT